MIIDIAGNASLTRLRRALTPTGTAVLVGGEDAGRLLGMSRQLRALVVSLFSRQRLTMRVPKESAADLERLTALVEGGQVTPAVEKAYPLEQAAAAMQDLIDGRRPGQGRHHGALELVALAQRLGPAVRVEQEQVRRQRDRPGHRPELGRLEPAQPARRARTDAAAGVPAVEGRGALGVRREHAGRLHAVRHRVLGVVAVEVLGGQRQPQRPGVVAGGVDHDRGQLGVVGPGAAVEVVRADGRPGVVDDAGLGVHVDRRALVVLDPVDGDPVGRDPRHVEHRAPPPQELRGPAEPLDVRVHRHHGDHLQVGVRAQRLAEDVADVVAPQVLVLDVEQVPGALDRLGVAAGHAALAAAGELVVAAPAQVGIGAQQLDDVGAAVDGRRWWRLLRAAGRARCRGRAAGPGAG